MFDYILTGPISGVPQANIDGILERLVRRSHVNLTLPINSTSAVFAIAVTIYSGGRTSREFRSPAGKRCDHVCDYRDGGRDDCLVHPERLGAGRSSPAVADKGKFDVCSRGAWLAALQQHTAYVALIGILIGLGHSVLAMSGEKRWRRSIGSRASQAAQPGKGGPRHIYLQLRFHSRRLLLRIHDYSGRDSSQYFGNLISGLSMNFVGPYNLRLGFEGFVVLVGVLMLAGAVNTAL